MKLLPVVAAAAIRSPASFVSSSCLSGSSHSLCLRRSSRVIFLHSLPSHSLSHSYSCSCSLLPTFTKRLLKILYQQGVECCSMWSPGCGGGNIARCFQFYLAHPCCYYCQGRQPATQGHGSDRHLVEMHECACSEDSLKGWVQMIADKGQNRTETQEDHAGCLRNERDTRTR